jgi:hypothetical protein
MREEIECCSVVMVHPQSPMLLAAGNDAGSPTLPEVWVPKHTRLAEEVTAAVAETWGVVAVALFRADSCGFAGQMLMLTIADPPACGVRNLEWVPFKDFSENESVKNGTSTAISI